MRPIPLHLFANFAIVCSKTVFTFPQFFRIRNYIILRASAPLRESRIGISGPQPLSGGSRSRYFSINGTSLNALRYRDPKRAGFRITRSNHPR